MNCRQKSPQPRTKNPAYRRAFERLDEALSKNTQSSDEDNIEKIIEKIQMARLMLFGSTPGTVILSD